MLQFINASIAGGAIGSVLGEIGGELINKGIDSVSGWFGGGEEPATKSASLGGASPNIQASFNGLAESNASVLSKVTNLVEEDGTSSPEQLLEVQHMMYMRQQLISTISNVVKSLHDMMMSVIGNLRL